MDPQQSNPTSPSSIMAPTNSRTLTLTYSRPGEGGETHHAIIPFPERYEQAVTDALKLLGQYMANSNPQPKHVVLKSRRKRDGQWIWAEFDPTSWLLIVQPDTEIGVFEREALRVVAAKEIFWRGPFYLVFGETKNSLTSWSGFNTSNRGDPSKYSIDRPASYAEAVEATRDCIARYYKPRIGTTAIMHMGDAIDRVHKPESTLTFYLFLEQHKWVAFPPRTTTDEDAWQAVIPGPGGIMGVIAT
ncbi:hypothetical protein C8R45DRAFT_1003361 [Mycena sanguinolenta]|nr:hypothetical protein C8R45DRAFT_1003361 [Mycena sanguinolenta]